MARNKQTQTMTQKAKAKAEVAAPTKHACICGCGTLVKNLFAQGHDQRVRGMLLRADGDTSLLPKSVQEAISRGLIKKTYHEANQPVLRARAA